MPSWNDVLDELNREASVGPLDKVRRHYIGKLHEKTNRNIICYYSGWLQKPSDASASINDNDKNGFMTNVHGLDKSIGLDLLLHTPGGDIAATESLVDYLRIMFSDDIRVIVPQIAMSAGTMIACSAKEIVMGKQSNLGPIDPQFNGIPAHGVLEEFERAKREIATDQRNLAIWQTVIAKYHPTFIGECEHAITLSTELVSSWLKDVMFAGDDNPHDKAQKIVEALNNHSDTKTHSRHIHAPEAISFGLKVKMLEEDQDLQDLVLTIHHSFMHTLANTSAIKIIENHKGKAMIQNQNQ